MVDYTFLPRTSRSRSKLIVVVVLETLRTICTYLSRLVAKEGAISRSNAKLHRYRILAAYGMSIFNFSHTYHFKTVYKSLSER